LGPIWAFAALKEQRRHLIPVVPTSYFIGRTHPCREFHSRILTRRQRRKKPADPKAVHLGPTGGPGYLAVEFFLPFEGNWAKTAKRFRIRISFFPLWSECCLKTEKGSITGSIRRGKLAVRLAGLRADFPAE